VRGLLYGWIIGTSRFVVCYPSGTGECNPAGRWIKADRLHPLVPRETPRWRKLYKGRASVEREFGRLKNEWSLAPLRVRGLERVQLHADLTILARLPARSQGHAQYRSRRSRQPTYPSLMGRYELRPDEVAALRVVLQAITIDEPSGEIGIVHGPNRFVTSRYGLSSESIKGIAQLARKLDVPGGLRTFRD
jgi:hypothetical protein